MSGWNTRWNEGWGGCGFGWVVEIQLAPDPPTVVYTAVDDTGEELVDDDGDSLDFLDY